MVETTIKKNSTSNHLAEFCFILLGGIWLSLVTFSTNLATINRPIYLLKGKRDLALNHGRVKKSDIM